MNRFKILLFLLFLIWVNNALCINSGDNYYWLIGSYEFCHNSRMYGDNREQICQCPGEMKDGVCYDDLCGNSRFHLG